MAQLPVPQLKTQESRGSSKRTDKSRSKASVSKCRSPAREAAEKPEEARKTKPDSLVGVRLRHGKNELLFHYKMGSGSYGEVYRGTFRGNKVAIKVELEETKQLLREYDVYRALNKCRPGLFLRVFQIYRFSHCETAINAMVFEKAGAALEDVVCETGPFPRGVNAPTVVSMAIQLVDALGALHVECGAIHRDITPRNILLGAPKRGRDKFGVGSDSVYLIDFGLSKTLVDPTSVDRLEESKKPLCNKVVGTPRYCSKRAHRQQVMTERDDLLSLIYVLVFLGTGNLPWASKYKGRDRNLNIGAHKYRIDMAELCAPMPMSVCKVAAAVDRLTFGEAPDYIGYLRELRAELEVMKLTDRDVLRHKEASETDTVCCWNYEAADSDKPALSAIEDVVLQSKKGRKTAASPVKSKSARKSSVVGKSCTPEDDLSPTTKKRRLFCGP